MIFVVMGVTGAGKSTIGKMLADHLGWVFLDADHFHSAPNKEKMRHGIPLEDADRMPWLKHIHEKLLTQNAKGKNVVLACSALKEEYRKQLSAGLNVKLVYLHGSKEFIAKRLRHRTGHFANETILSNQFDVIEEPKNAFLVVDIDQFPEQIVKKILQKMEGESFFSKIFEKQIMAKMRRRLLPLLFLLYVIAYLDRINVGFGILQMKEQLHFSGAVYGFGAGIFFLGYFLLQIPSNIALQKVGGRRWIGTLMILWGLISSMMSLVNSANSFYLLRFLLGCAEAGFFPGVIYYLRDWIPSTSRAGMIALFMTAGPVAGVLGSPLSGALLNMDRIYNLAGWQWMFLLEGLPAALLGVIIWLFLANKPEEVRWLNLEEKKWLKQTLTTTIEPQRKRTLIGSSSIWRFALIAFSLNCCSYSVTFWLPSALQALKSLPYLSLGMISAIPYLIAVIAMVSVGMHSDATGERRWHIALSALVGACALFIAGANTILALGVGVYGIALASSSSMAPPLWALANDTLTKSTAAKGIALINAVGNLGSGLAPYWIGYSYDKTGDLLYGLWTVVVLLLLAGLVVLSIRPKENQT